ncbi:DUF4124 domain-containing protein [Acidovorax cavernicola]|uniref:DUF4124 domain-containing protein n=1 Tax=Acidovorax cavernicola TaxID=1675792 RepID=A0A9X8GUS4_9BURK|nr:DUF4124 domain-containing protein [Acidovorax cavernicola]RIX79105.1 DUF4124 domain-containing protein [Acidovorax cavernicola]
MRLLFVAALFAVAQPSWALYKCVGAGGATSFQETPCERAQAQTAIKPLVEAPKPAVAPSGPSGEPSSAVTAGRPTLDQQVKDAEADRLRREAGYTLRDKTAQLERHRQACDSQQREILANTARARNNLAGATYAQSIATEANAAALRCETRGREIQSEVEEARRQCTARGCS